MASPIVAWAYNDGRGVTKDPDRGRQLRIRACDLGYASDCGYQGRNESDDAEAERLLRRGCDLGDATACHGVYQRAHKAADSKTMQTLTRRLCGMGWADHCVEIGQQHQAKNELDEARTMFARACKYGETVNGCAAELALLQGQARDERAAKLPIGKRDLALYTCCDDDAAPPASPTAAVLRMSTAIGDKNAKAVGALIHPKHPLKLRLGTHGDMGSSEDAFKIRSNKVDITKLDGVMSFGDNGLECGEIVDDVAQCSVVEGGFGASYEVTRIGGRYYVTGIDEESH
jgi:hypothetical protein